MKKPQANHKQPPKRSTGVSTRLIALGVIVALAVVVALALTTLKKPAAAAQQTTTAAAAGTPAGQAPGAGKAAAGQNAAGDLVIPVSAVSSKATFYPATVNGVKLEVLAVKAPDNSIRTAFNTCQVCYDSGRGYYKQEGDVLVCQNCGNRFKISQVEVSKGGCNPVPIFDKEIQMDPTSITIPAAYLKEATEIFENWKVGA